MRNKKGSKTFVVKLLSVVSNRKKGIDCYLLVGDCSRLLEGLGGRVPGPLLLEALARLQKVGLGGLDLSELVEEDGRLAVLVAGSRQLRFPPDSYKETIVMCTQVSIFFFWSRMLRGRFCCTPGQLWLGALLRFDQMLPGLVERLGLVSAVDHGIGRGGLVGRDRHSSACCLASSQFDQCSRWNEYKRKRN